MFIDIHSLNMYGNGKISYRYFLLQIKIEYFIGLWLLSRKKSIHPMHCKVPVGQYLCFCSSVITSSRWHENELNHALERCSVWTRISCSCSHEMDVGNCRLSTCLLPLAAGFPALHPCSAIKHGVLVTPPRHESNSPTQLCLFSNYSPHFCCCWLSLSDDVNVMLLPKINWRNLIFIRAKGIFPPSQRRREGKAGWEYGRKE